MENAVCETVLLYLSSPMTDICDHTAIIAYIFRATLEVTNEPQIDNDDIQHLFKNI